MKRLLIVSAGLVALVVGVMGAWYAERQDHEFQRLISAGNAALGQGEIDGAIEAFSGAIALKEDSMLAYLRRGDAYRRRGEFDTALRDLGAAAALDPSAPVPLELSGDVHLAQGRYALAAADYQQFTVLDDQSPRVLYKLGLARYRSRQPGEAITPLQGALALDAGFAQAAYLLGASLRELNRSDEALQALTRAISLDPALAAAREELAILHGQAGRQRDALDQLEALAALEPSRVERQVAVGLAYAEWGRTESAILSLGRALDRYPDHPSVLAALGRVWLLVAEREQDSSALERAVGLLRPLASSAEATAETLTLYGRALMLSGRPADAERVLTTATDRLPVDPSALRYLAEAAGRLGHHQIARDALLRHTAVAGPVTAATTAGAPPSRPQ